MITLRDRLRTKIIGDQHLFFAFAGGGSILILITKALTDLRMEWIAAGAVLLMFLYAWIVGQKGIGKLRADQAGDNCYYLGLIYTLTSLAFAIFTFNPEETANVIVNGFGVALATTIVGLILRVFFNQSRVDIHEIEADVRQELVEAASRLKTQLTQVSIGFNDFALGLQQSMNELRQAATSSIKESSEQAIQTVTHLATVAGGELKGQSDQFNEQVSGLAEAVDNSREALERHTNSLEDLVETQRRTADSLLVVKDTVLATSEASEQLRQQLASLAELQISIYSLTKQLTENASKLGTLTDGSLGSLTELSKQIKAQLDQFEGAPTRTMDAALQAIAKAAERLERSINSVAEQHDDIRRSITTTSQEVLATLQEHNKAIDSELDKFRTSNSRVVDGFVGIIDDLRTEVIEGR